MRKTLTLLRALLLVKFLLALRRILLLTGLTLPRLRSLRIEPARLLLVLRTLRLRIPILRSLTAKALL